MSDLMKHLPSYYRSSKVMREMLKGMGTECDLLSGEVTETENQFIVVLADRELWRHEQDLGIAIDSGLSEDARKGRILSRLRGTGTVSKTMIKNVVSSFVNGEISIIERPNDYTFVVKFISKKGVPLSLADVQKAIEDIKPAHLAVEYVFTYRTWQEIKILLADWQEAKSYSWARLLTFESIYTSLESITNKLIIENGKVYYRDTGEGNAFIYYENNKAFARRVIL